MADSRKIVRVFLASPSDLREERALAKQVVDEFNALCGDQFGYFVELIGWEDTVSSYGRPQQTINQDVERCEYFIGMMWKSWGTPPGTDGKYTSGFEEEFELAISRRALQSKPEISLLFKEVEANLLLDPGESLRKVIGFREKIIAEKQLYFEQFNTARDFEVKIRRCIFNYVFSLRSLDVDSVDEEGQGSDSRQQSSGAQSKQKNSHAPVLSPESAAFLSSFASEAAESTSEDNKISRLKAARFRLLGDIIGRDGNDDGLLGVHDANTLFTARADLRLGDDELSGLVRCGLRNLENEIVPLWHWLSLYKGRENDRLAIHSFYGADEKRIGALGAMKLIEMPVAVSGVLNRKTFVDSWMSENTSDRVKIAALDYLADAGLSSDLIPIKLEIERGNYRTRSAAVEATVSISLREGGAKAFDALFEFQPERLNQALLGLVLARIQTLSTSVLLQALTHRCVEIRLKSLSVLRGRDDFSLLDAQKVLSDSDAQIRFEALNACIKLGGSFDENEVKRVLVRPVANGVLGATDTVGQSFFEKFDLQRLSMFHESDLTRLVESSSIFENRPYFARARRYFSIYGDALRHAINDRFKSYFSEQVDLLVKKGWSEVVEKTKPLEEFMRKNLVRSGVDIICEKADPKDLPLVRRVFDDATFDHSEADVEYLKKFGEWEDISILLKVAKKVDYSRGLLFSGPKYVSLAAAAIYKIGKDRLSELLQLDTSGDVKARIVLCANQSSFKALKDVELLQLLFADSEELRKVCALKCVRLFTKDRLRRLMKLYNSGDSYRYYNVVYWLDFGISSPRDEVIRSSDVLLSKF